MAKKKTKLQPLPPIRNRVEAACIDGTPEGYPLRILQFYRAKSNQRWEVHGLPKGTTALYDLMNEHQVERAKELDKAIAKLEKAK